MICACDRDETDLACWTKKGETFVVKNPDVFSSVVIPRFFKREFASVFPVTGWSTRRPILSCSSLFLCFVVNSPHAVLFLFLCFFKPP